MLRVRISPEQEALLDEGKQVEIMVGQTLFILQRSDDGRLHINLLTEGEVLGESRFLRSQGLV